jgi:hypothetical protein
MIKKIFEASLLVGFTQASEGPNLDFSHYASKVIKNSEKLL